ncbi:hypothetical protein KL932_000742 [Ogataea haglerorum]|nr:hypothetical protein KL950_000024 [Ogataea haglerorum]KAG7745712.1 hypothetical protein KL932_000742 [Ogataea haglerorum]KAG7761572.1 hypothetical protein KL947_000520 [Ogataea haglerorum]
MEEKDFSGSPVTITSVLDTSRVTEVCRKRWLFTFVEAKDYWLLLPALVFTILSAMVPATVAVLLARIFNKLESFGRNEYSSGYDFVADVQWLCFAIAFVGLGATFFNWLGLSCFLLAGERQQKRCRQEVYRSLLRKEVEWFDKKSDLNSNLLQVNRCIEEFRMGVSECLEMLIKSVAMLCALLVLSFYYSWRLTLLVVATIPIIVLVTGVWGILIGKYTALENKHSEDTIKVLEWNLLNYLWIKIVDSSSLEKRKLDAATKLTSQSFLKMKLFFNLNAGMIKFLALMMFVQSFWYGSFLVRKHLNSSGDIVSCFYSCLTVSRIFSTISSQIVSLKTAWISLKYVFESVNCTGSAYEGGFRPKHDIMGEIKISNVSFKYPVRDDWGLNNITLQIPANHLLYIVGKSGSGKSTLASLILRLYHFDGKITCDDYDISRLDQSWLASQITLVQQQCTLFGGTIFENLTLASPTPVAPKLLNEALQITGLDQLIASLPAGLNTKVGGGSGSITLSGGQRQKVALSRAIIRNTPVLILDEALSAVDYNQRIMILEKLKRNRNRRSTVIMTHDYSEIADSDYVVLMESGKIEEQGLKSDLLKGNTRFASLQYEMDTPDNPFGDEKEEEELEERMDQPDELENQTPEKVSMLQLLRQLWHVLTFGSRVCFLLGIMISVVNASMTPLFTFFLSKLILGIVTVGQQVSSAYMVKWSLVLMCVAFMDGLSLFASKMALSQSSETLVGQLRNRAFEKILAQPICWFQKINPGALSSLLINDIRDLRTMISDVPSQLISIIALLLIAMVWSLIVCWRLALVGLSFAPLFAIFSTLFSILLQKYETAYKQASDDVEEVVHESVLGMKTVVSLNLQGHFQAKFNDHMNQLKHAGKRRALIISIAMAAQNIAIYLSQAIMLYYGIKLVSEGSITLVQMMQVVALIMFTVGYVSAVLSSMPNVNKGVLVFMKILTLIQLPENIQEYYGTTKPIFNPNKPLIKFQNVQFSYGPGTAPVLCNFNFSLNINMITCIVGRSGCGKSTLLNLLFRLFSPQRGSIKFCGTNLDQLHMSELKKEVAVVTQNHYFFDGTIFENLTYNLHKPVTKAQIYEALELVDMADFVHGLPDNLFSRIGGSSNLLISGGQLQRLCIARALIRSPKVLVLDECTASLDPQNVKRVAKILLGLKKHVTIIMVSHQREMMQIADTVAYMEDGIIKEKGHFDTLSNRRNLFYRLIN